MTLSLRSMIWVKHRFRNPVTTGKCKKTTTTTATTTTSTTAVDPQHLKDKE